MLQIQPRRDFWDIPYSVLANDQGVVAVMRDERYTRLFAGADELRSQLLAATTLLETLSPVTDVSAMNQILLETGERQP